MERQNFEDNLKDAFTNAELTPSDAVWNGIELDLMKAESKKMKNRIVFYKMLAAASVIFGLALASSGFYFFNEIQGTQDLAVATNPQNKSNHQTPSSDETKSTSRSTEEASDDESMFQDEGQKQPVKTDNAVANNRHNTIKEGTTETSARDQSTLGSETGIEPGYAHKDRSSNAKLFSNNFIAKNLTPETSSTAEAVNEVKDTGAEANSLNEGTNEPFESMVMTLRRPQLAYLPPVKMNLPEEPKADEVALMLARLGDLEKAEQQKEKKDKNAKESLWTSVGFAAGAFTGGNASVATKPTMNTFVANTTHDIADKEANAAGISYSVG
jgi:hypothetical protein